MTVPIVPRRGGDAGAGIDPRFRARRAAVKGAHDARRRIYRLVLLVLVAALALAAVIVLESPILDVDAVDVTGARATGADEVAEAAGIGFGSALLLADLEGAEARVEALPWVEEASVVRDLPGTVHVDVIERTPAAVVGDGTRSVLVDPDGRVLADGDPGTYPAAATEGPPFVRVEVDGEVPAVGDTVDEAYLDALTLAARLRGDPAGAVAAVEVTPSLQLELATPDGGPGPIVEFGDADQIDGKVEAFRTIFARVDRSCVTEIDLRVPERPVLTRGAPCS